MWISNCSMERTPDMARLLGARVEPDGEHLTIYVPVPYAKDFILNLSPVGKLAFLFAVIYDNTSFQLKGTYVSHWSCTDDEIDFQRNYVQAFCRELTKQGFNNPKVPFKVYFQQPSIAVRMKVEEIYEQTPKEGTGEQASF